MNTIIDKTPGIRGAIARMIDDIRWPETEAVLATGSIALFGFSLWAVIYNQIPEANEKYVMLMLGALIGIVKDTFARYFSSTKGAADQRKDLMGVITTQTDAATTLATETARNK
jgi:hypothetical protein